MMLAVRRQASMRQRLDKIAVTAAFIDASSWPSATQPDQTATAVVAPISRIGWLRLAWLTWRRCPDVTLGVPSAPEVQVPPRTQLLRRLSACSSGLYALDPTPDHQTASPPVAHAGLASRDRRREHVRQDLMDRGVPRHRSTECNRVGREHPAAARARAVDVDHGRAVASLASALGEQRRCPD